MFSTADKLQDDVRMMREIEQFYSTQIEEMPMFVAVQYTRCIMKDLLTGRLGTLPISSKTHTFLFAYIVAFHSFNR